MIPKPMFTGTPGNQHDIKSKERRHELNNRQCSCGLSVPLPPRSVILLPCQKSHRRGRRGDFLFVPFHLAQHVLLSSDLFLSSKQGFTAGVAMESVCPPPAPSWESDLECPGQEPALPGGGGDSRAPAPDRGPCPYTGSLTHTHVQAQVRPPPTAPRNFICKTTGQSALSSPLGSFWNILMATTWSEALSTGCLRFRFFP